MLAACLVIMWALGAATPPSALQSPPFVTGSAAVGAYFDYFLLIILENHNLCQILTSCGGTAGFMSSFATDHGMAMEDRYCSVNPSLPNYLCLTGGSDFGCAGSDNLPDSNPCTQAAWAAPSIVDRIEAAGLSWKAYMEDMPAACTSSDAGLYIAHHDPFVYYQAIATNAARCDRVVPAGTDASALVADLGSTSTASNYMWLTPNNCHNMHSCSISQGDAFLSTLLPQVLDSSVFKNSRAALVITFDEGYGQPIYTVWAGPTAKVGFRSFYGYSHFSVLATLESNWNLSPLTENDRDAPDMAEFFVGQPAREGPASPIASILALGAIAGGVAILGIVALMARRRKRVR